MEAFSTKDWERLLAGRRPCEGEWSSEQIGSHLSKGLPFRLISKQGVIQAFILYLKIGTVIEVTYLETALPYRGQGIMVKLLEGLFEQHSECRVWLDVHHKNAPALGLYKKLGFKNSGLRKGYYRDGGDCLLLERPSEGA